jgi:hypothetical protein
MTAPGNDLLIVILTLSVILSGAYAIGRIHQWHRHGQERDEAYHAGYDKASRSIIGMMGEPRLSGTGEEWPPPGSPRSHVGRGRGDSSEQRILTFHRQPYSPAYDEGDHAGTR